MDHFVPLLFLDVSTVQHEEFCRGYRLCQEFEMASSRIDEIREGLCQRSVSAVLSELKDPESHVCTSTIFLNTYRPTLMFSIIYLNPWKEYAYVQPECPLT